MIVQVISIRTESEFGYFFVGWDISEMLTPYVINTNLSINISRFDELTSFIQNEVGLCSIIAKDSIYKEIIRLYNNLSQYPWHYFSPFKFTLTSNLHQPCLIKVEVDRILSNMYRHRINIIIEVKIRPFI